MNQDARKYVDAIAPEYRPLFDRIHRLALEVRPDVDVILSYRIPTYVAGSCRLYVGVWKHGLSLYGWRRDHDAGFTDRHPDLVSSTGTLRLPPAAAAGISDDELRDLVRATFGADRGQR